jgi:hypothetical protein
MSDEREDIRSEYEALKQQFRGMDPETFKSGDWFANVVQWLLTTYARKVDAAYIRKTYAGASSGDQAKKAISLAARANSIAGGVAASAITAIELSSLGPQAAITVPAVATLVLTDVAFSSRTQLRTTYDLSVIRGAPLSVDDVEDCYLIFLTAMGVKLHEMVGGVGKAVGPQVVAYNVRKLLRSGLRKALLEVLKKIGGAKLAKLLTERAMLRLLVPGISIPIAAGFNHFFTKQVLRVADVRMRRRAAIVQPLVRMHHRDTAIPRALGAKLLIAVSDCGSADGWNERQLEGLRHCQGALALTDDQLKEFDAYFDKTMDDLLAEIPAATSARNELSELAITQAALDERDAFDSAYAAAIAKLHKHLNLPDRQDDIIKEIERARAKLR